MDHPLAVSPRPALRTGTSRPLEPLPPPGGLARARPTPAAAPGAAAAGTREDERARARLCIAFLLYGRCQEGKEGEGAVVPQAALGTAVNTCRGRPTLGWGWGAGHLQGKEVPPLVEMVEMEAGNNILTQVASACCVCAVTCVRAPGCETGNEGITRR